MKSLESRLRRSTRPVKLLQSPPETPDIVGALRLLQSKAEILVRKWTFPGGEASEGGASLI